MIEWKPIETAPKDGTIILAYGDENLDKFIPYTAAYWQGGQMENGFFIKPSWQLVNLFGDMLCEWGVEPKYWMSIPVMKKKD